MAVMTWGLASVLFGSFLVCALLVVTQRWHGRLSLDHDLSGVQKLHRTPVPRVGGLGLAAGLAIGGVIAMFLDPSLFPLLLQLLLCSLPVFVAGFTEDLTKRVSVKARLYSSFASAALAVMVIGTRLTRTDTPALDMLLAITPISVIFTCFAVGGMTHAVNIIDGLNGLAAGCATLMLLGLAAIAWQVNDIIVLKLCLLGVAALLGFMLLNFPFGRIFLGDGGAYLTGFWIAQCGLLLLQRNPSVSTWAVLLCCAYPVWETVYSMYRRNVKEKVSTGRPDMVHLHHQLYKHLSQVPAGHFLPNWAKHATASLLIWLLVAACLVVAAWSYSDTSVLAIAVAAFVFLYNLIYRQVSALSQTSQPSVNIAIRAE